ncbi:hypothetical protein EVAR_27990_1 [Eumeta japonica]|uniref:Uncharacterized protein n=1 Tax=Eumeta variegata TaxID=151549 RepID=A0A4C1WEK1_EUMVA|nr:hypothetical protein EVAR_27990_1 [Eumeta japonica]
MREFGWGVLMGPPCSPDLAPSDFHLFRSLQNSLDSVRFSKRAELMFDSRRTCQTPKRLQPEARSFSFFYNLSRLHRAPGAAAGTAGRLVPPPAPVGLAAAAIKHFYDEL